MAGVAEKLRRYCMSEVRRRLILFARYPIAGRVKIRLIPALGAEGATALHRRLVLRALRTAHKAYADTLLLPERAEVVPRTLRTSGVAAGAFRFRSRWLQRPYGDQGLFLPNTLFEEMGGFADLPIMEDYEFTVRLRRDGRIVTVGEPALTSGRRWQTLGVLRTTLRNQWMLAGYQLGVNHQKLATCYQETKFNLQKIKENKDRRLPDAVENSRAIVME